MASQRKARKRRTSKFSKRKQTVLRKAHELQRDCDAEVYLYVRNKRSNQVWRYTSGIQPPLETEMVCLIHTAEVIMY
ncbi:Transcription factor, MADS-box [Moelleriella libera RCEF 2490]|uniref:Transcription factor, MADS-box n=1 Tax=Moelleriella libera RCEF 2490 TaxID=1081109 RepID=A0A167WG37_9HYPO|nr:Transcription factor, MADS-box [Moelleriella libera RCEF 2490]